MLAPDEASTRNDYHVDNVCTVCKLMHCHPRARGRLAMCTGNEREHNYRKYGTVKARPYGARPGLQGNSEEERTLLAELGTGARGRWRGGRWMVDQFPGACFSVDYLCIAREKGAKKSIFKYHGSKITVIIIY